MKLGFIGVGNMGGAVLKGLLKGKKIRKDNVYVRNSSDESTKRIADKYGVLAGDGIEEVAKKSDIIVIGVKPYLVGNVLKTIREHIKEDTVIVSMAAFVAMIDIEKELPEKQKIVRIMPNTPVEIGEGVVGVVFNNCFTSEEKNSFCELFSPLGEQVRLGEEKLDALTAVSGSGPAYVYLFIEALADGAVLNGLDRKTAYKLAAQTVKGSANMVLESQKHPGELKDEVCSPGGSTIEAVRVLEEKNFRSAVIECERACYKKLSGEK